MTYAVVIKHFKKLHATELPIDACSLRSIDDMAVVSYST